MRRLILRLVIIVAAAFSFLVWLKNDSGSETEQRVKNVVVESAVLTGDIIDEVVNQAKENGHTHHFSVDFELPF